MAEIKIKVPKFGDKVLVVGTERKKGNYEGKEYDNINIHGLAYKEAENGEKVMVNDTWKIKYNAIKTIPKVGDTIQALFTRNGQIVDFETIEATYEKVSAQ